MAKATIYATAIHKRSENQGYYGYAVWKKNAKKPTEKLGNYDCESKIRLQLRTLIDGISALKNSKEYDDVTVITDFTLISNLLDGTVMEWSMNEWVKSNEKPIPEADLWKELNDLAVEYNILFTEPKAEDEKMNDLSKKVASNKNSKKKTTAKTNKKPSKKSEPTVEEDSTPLQNQVALPEVVVPTVEEKVIKIPEKKMASRLKSATTSSEEVSKIVAQKNDGTIKVDETLKQECTALFGELGLDVDTAVTMFLKDSLRRKGLSLELKL